MIEHLTDVCVILITINCWYSVDASQTYDTYFEIRPGQIAVRGFYQLATGPLTSPTNSIYECAALCVNAMDSDHCGGFIYQPDSCDDGSGSPTKSGTCQLGRLFSQDLLLFGPSNTLCQQFYVSQTPPSPGFSSLIWAHKVYNIEDFNVYQPSPPYALIVNADTSTTACLNDSNWLHPWWLVDMGNLRDIQVVKVANSKNPAKANTLDNFMVGLTNTMPSLGQSLTAGVDFTVCGQYNGTVPVGAIVGVVCPKPPAGVTYRYLLLIGMLNTNSNLCLNEIYAY